MFFKGKERKLVISLYCLGIKAWCVYGSVHFSFTYLSGVLEGDLMNHKGTICSLGISCLKAPDLMDRVSPAIIYYINFIYICILK